MPPKGKASKAKAAESSKTQSTATPPPPAQATPPPPEPPKTVYERSLQAYHTAHPFASKIEQSGLASLTPDEHLLVSHAAFARASPDARNKLFGGAKAQREAWRFVNEHNLPVRFVGGIGGETNKNRGGGFTKPPAPEKWGTDRLGRKIGEYSLQEAAERSRRQDELACREVASRRFRERREAVRLGCRKDASGEKVVLADSEVAEERVRRGEIARLRKELFGQKMGAYEMNPLWDDVVPVPMDEPEGALASIAYPDDYAEAVSYLRAVMIKKEYSNRCLQLTEHIISMNPAHYTVWLYRASIIFAMNLSIPAEIEWLNGVALEHLKNYQIWHHRHLLVEHHHPTITSDPAQIAAFAASERAFLATILAEDTKNYHVWSYRTWLVGKLGVWGDAAELAAVAAMVDDDVRNNSAWSHRFFLVFSDPAHADPASPATAHDPSVPAEIVEREVRYAMDKTYLAPQNPSAWNYLRGVLVKGGRPFASVEGFVREFVKGVEEGEDKEDVKSTLALDLLAEIYAEKGDKEKADLCLRRLAEKWDRIRVGYWEWRRKWLREGE